MLLVKNNRYTKCKQNKFISVKVFYTNKVNYMSNLCCIIRYIILC